MYSMHIWIKSSVSTPTYFNFVNIVILAQALLHTSLVFFYQSNHVVIQSTHPPVLFLQSYLEFNPLVEVLLQTQSQILKIWFCQCLASSSFYLSTLIGSLSPNYQKSESANTIGNPILNQVSIQIQVPKFQIYFLHPVRESTCLFIY